MKQAMQDALCPLYVPYCLGLRVVSHWICELALVPGAFWPNFRGRVVSSNDHVLVRIELRGAIIELAPKSKMASGCWSCEHHVKLFKFMLTHTQSERLLTFFTGASRTHV